MKVCFFPHYSATNRDGATLSMYELIDQLLRRGVEVAVVLPNRNHLEDRLKDERIDFIPAPMYSLRMTVSALTPVSRLKFAAKYLFNISRVPRIVRLLRARGVTLVHLNGLDGPVGALAARRLGVPCVWHIRAFMEEDLGKTLFARRRTYGLARGADAVIGISEDIRKKFAMELGRPVERIYNGVPPEKYLLSPRDILTGPQARLLLAGRISPQKGQLDALRAMELLRARGFRGLRLTIVGQAETEEALRELRDFIAQRDLGGQVSVLPPMDDLSALRAAHDIGLTCSLREAFGRVTVENMMAGLLAVGARSGGTPEIIGDKTTGLLYDPGQPESLADAIEFALRRPEEARRAARRGRERALARFTIQRAAEEVLRVYETLAAPDAGGEA